MTVISSQKYLDYSIVDTKIRSLTGETAVTLPVVLVGELDGEQLYALVDGHHTLEAAKELGIEIAYEITGRSQWGYDESWTLEEALENLWLDSDWYDVETGLSIF